KLPGGAERAADRTTRLRRDAQRGTVHVAHHDRLHRVAAVELEEGLGGAATVRLRYGYRPERCGAELGIQRDAERFRQLAHRVERRGAAAEPAPDLLAAVRRGVVIGDPLGELGGGQGKNGRGDGDLITGGSESSLRASMLTLMVRVRMFSC